MATLLPLEYGDRLETYICYFSKNWEELVDILDMPHEALRLLGRGWEIKDAPASVKDTNWTLRGALTAVIKPAWQSPDAAMRLASHLAASGNEGSTALETRVSSIDRSADTHEVSGQFKEMLLESEAIETGCFLIEFAIGTSFLNVFYVPPRPVAEEAQRRFNAGISESTLCRVVVDTDAGEQVVSATLHFDLGEVCPPPAPMQSRDRANLIVDTLVSRAGLIELLDKPTRIGDGKMVPRGEAIVYPGMERTETLTFKARENAYPTVTVEGLGTSPECCICTITEVSVDGSDYYLGDMYYKLYCPEPPPPPPPPPPAPATASPC
ncbi:hypothetical protein EON82_06895 [bacterium]|nr:MAG: hypothetical protein EON82_06895 [bacterium]